MSDNKKPVNVRKGASTNYTKLFVVNYGTPVTVLEHGKTWDKIRYNGKTGYIMTRFLQLSKPKDVEDFTPVPDPTPMPDPVGKTKTVTSPDGKSVNFHQGPGLGYSDVTGCMHLKVGSKVTVLEVTANGKWTKVEYEGYKGWIMSKYLK